jgi:Uma2 family endonuclease
VFDGLAKIDLLIDPDERSVFVYPLDQPTTFYDDPTAQLPVPESVKGFNLTVESLFGWLTE